MRLPSEEWSRLIPHSADEVAWARRRPARHRVPVPAVGDTVLYRHDDWTEPTEAQVLWVQPLDDAGDPNVCQVLTEHGAVLLVDGQPVVAILPDPWPKLRLATRHGQCIAREARLRGSAGWLPLDWRDRYRPIPRAIEVATAVAPYSTRS